MKLDSKYYSFCKEIGLMKENYSRESALQAIKDAIAKEKAADPEFVEYVKKLTLTSPEVTFRACILYHYNVVVEYVKNNVINDTTINDIGTIGIADYLHITEYKGKGDYTVVKDMNAVPYSYWNEKNLLTFEDMKGVLSNTVEKALPKGTQSFRSKDWDVSAYLVPVLSVVIKRGDKYYYCSYNLQNGYYHWEYPDNPELLARGKNTKLYIDLVRLGAVVLSVLGLIFAISRSTGNALAFIAPILVGLINIILWKKTNKKGKYFDRFFIKNPDKTIVSQLIPGFVSMGFGFLSMIFGLL